MDGRTAVVPSCKLLEDYLIIVLGQPDDDAAGKGDTEDANGNAQSIREDTREFSGRKGAYVTGLEIKIGERR